MQTIYDTKKEGLVSEVYLTPGAASTDYLAHKIAYDYDDLLRVQSKTELINGQDYTYSYQYDDLGRTKYMTYPTGLKIRNKYNSKGFLKEILDANTTKSIWNINTDGYDKLGRLVGYSVNNNDNKAIVTTKEYDEQTGLLTHINTYSNNQQVQDLHYTYDILGNMKSRSHTTVNGILLSEDFNYDELNRLIDVTTRVNGNINNTIDYDYADNGNIENISNIGSFSYAETQNAGPYAISGVDFNNREDIPLQQNISYTAFDKIKQLSHINGNGILNGKIEISYGLDQQRLYQITTLENGTTKEKYFIGGLYEKEICDGSIKELCYISTPAGAIAIKETQNNNDNWLFLTHDHLGSVHCIMNEEGFIQQELSFDPYGNRRDPNTWKPYVEGQEPTYMLDRGYTFHEHWDDFDLINMNGRVYDPIIARFLSPDPYVQSPGYSQNFNRYSYVLNNPLKYTDPDGEWIHLAIGAVVGGVFNWATHGADFDLDGAKYFAIGAVAGVLAAGVGAGVGAALAGNAAAGGGFAAGFIGTQTITSTGFAAGAISGGFAGVSNGLVMGTGNGMMVGQGFGEAFYSKEDWLTGSPYKKELYTDGETFITGEQAETSIIEKKGSRMLPETEEPYYIEIKAPRGCVMTTGKVEFVQGDKNLLSFSSVTENNSQVIEFPFGTPQGGRYSAKVLVPFRLRSNGNRIYFFQ